MSSGADIRLEPKPSGEAPPTYKCGCRFILWYLLAFLAEAVGSSTKAPVRWNLPRGVPLTAVVETKCLYEARRRAARVFFLLFERALATKKYSGSSHEAQVRFRFLTAR